MISHLWSSTKVAYEKNVAFGISHSETKQKLFYRARQAVQSIHKVHSQMKILSIVKISVDKQFGYGYLKEIVVRRTTQKEYTFKEADFPRLHLNDIEDMYLICVGLDTKEPYTIFYEPRGVVYLNKDNKKYLIRADEVYRFGDGTLKKAHDRLDYMLHNFELGYTEETASTAGNPVKEIL
ncbi:hypothetical protein Tco_1392097 [Tanacetum coccineum]